ncbi:hypothetical protein DXG01_016513 [Tephrocybe rancida]|nr:hypothetical protein DXG01_016513 [Tephrocybe rancida]
MTKPEREALFHKCSADISRALHDGSTMYPRGWFLLEAKSISHRIRRQDVVTWLLWALFSCPPEQAQDDWKDELDVYVETVEKLLGECLNDDGESNAKSMRLTLDPVKVVHRPLIWYCIVCLVDTLTSLQLLISGFKHYSSTPKWFQTFPPRPLLSFFSNNAEVSPNILLPHWYRPHKSTTKLPVVFIHGIGIGLHPYLPFIRDLVSRDPDVGILLVELLPISMHMTSQPVAPSPLIASALNNILDDLRLTRVVLASHSYGTFVASCILHDSRTSHSPTSPPHPLLSKIAHTLLIDPIPVLLHLPPVAYNFLYRVPSSAAEWQLWYFASTDPDVARTLGRAFFWTEGVAWKEDIRRWMRAEDHGNPSQNKQARGRNVAVVLAGADQIVPAESVRRYLTEEVEPSAKWIGRQWARWVDAEPGLEPEVESARQDVEVTNAEDVVGGDLEVFFYPNLDHATVFDTPERWGPMLSVLERFVQDT